MKQSTKQKSSFSLPASEIPLITKLKKQLRLTSNTEVVRRALRELQNKTDRELVRRQFQEASRLVTSINAEEMKTLDYLSDEGL